MENNKNTKKYPHTEADEAFNRVMAADEQVALSAGTELGDGSVRSVTTREVIPGLRIDAPVVSALGGSAVNKELIQASLDNSGAELKSAMDRAKAERTGQNWERLEDAQANARAVDAYAAAAGRSDLAGSGEVMQSAGPSFTAEQIADMNAQNQNAARPKNPTGWEQK